MALLAPVFWAGELFGWVANSLHQWDMGGTSPSGFNPIAEDVFWESAVIPPIKIVEGGMLRRDLEESYVRFFAQEGALNCTYIAWRVAIASMISVQMLYDQIFAVEGAYRHPEV